MFVRDQKMLVSAHSAFARVGEVNEQSGAVAFSPHKWTSRPCVILSISSDVEVGLLSYDDCSGEVDYP